MSLIVFLSFSEKLWLTNPSFSFEVSQIPLPGETKEQTIVPEVSTTERRSELPEHATGRKASNHKKLKSYRKELRWMCTNNYGLCYMHTAIKRWGFKLKCGFFPYLSVLKIAVNYLISWTTLLWIKNYTLDCGFSFGSSFKCCPLFHLTEMLLYMWKIIVFQVEMYTPIL